ncbi:MAG: linear amide C-N hydrolase [Oscillospiraceae bacterium]|nr:linear amide C-N hydrolase [Oscillospiraceae bacterium]
MNTIMRNISAAVVMLACCLTGCTTDATDKADTDVNGIDTAETSAVSLDTAEETAAETAAQEQIYDVKSIAEGIYSLDYLGGYMLDEYLDADIRTTEEMDRWFMENLTDGISTEGSEYDIACSSFAVTLSDSEHIFGRNYDLRPSDAMFIRTSHEDGYSSIGIVDLAHMNIGTNAEHEIDSDNGRSLLSAAPYCICDGINEKGLGVSLLQLDITHTVNDTDKHDLLLYSSLRAMLDKCADVDEAVEFLTEHDIYSPASWSYHVFLTDRSGKSVTVEWLEDGQTVVEDDAVTNFVLFEAPPTRVDGRYMKMRKALDDGKVSSKADAMALLAEVMQKGSTCWSAVYDLDSFTVEVCFNGDYEHKYTFSGERS